MLYNYPLQQAGKVYSLIPLEEILSEIYQCGVNTKKVKRGYEHLLTQFGPELKILLNLETSKLEKEYPRLSEALDLMRQEKVDPETRI